MSNVIVKFISLPRQARDKHRENSKKGLTSPTHQPNADFVHDYAQVFDAVCAASARAHAPCPDFLAGLAATIVTLGGPQKSCTNSGAEELAEAPLEVPVAEPLRPLAAPAMKLYGIVSPRYGSEN